MPSYSKKQQLNGFQPKPEGEPVSSWLPQKLAQDRKREQARIEARTRKEPYIPLYSHPFLLSENRGPGPIQVVRGQVLIFQEGYQLTAKTRDRKITKRRNILPPAIYHHGYLWTGEPIFQNEPLPTSSAIVYGVNATRLKR